MARETDPRLILLHHTESAFIFLTWFAGSLFGGVAPGLDLSVLRDVAPKATSQGGSKEPPKVVQLHRSLTPDPNL